MIAPSRMRSIVASLLLVLALPGLLLPAGIVWHFCRCAPRATTPARSCCHPATAPAVEPESTCCRGGARPDSPHDGVPHARAHACGCVWLALPDLQQDRVLPDVAVPQPLATAPAIATIAWLAPREVAPAHVWRRADIYHPPPDAHRNLPLRS